MSACIRVGDKQRCATHTTLDGHPSWFAFDTPTCQAVFQAQQTKMQTEAEATVEAVARWEQRMRGPAEECIRLARESRDHIAKQNARIAELEGMLKVCRDEPRDEDEQRIGSLQAENERLRERGRNAETVTDEMVERAWRYMLSIDLGNANTEARHILEAALAVPDDDRDLPSDEYRSINPAPNTDAYENPAPSKLSDEIERAINRHSAENGSNTADFVLAGFLMGCLAAFDAAVNERQRLADSDKVPG